jgi:hypothetical protein
VALSNIDEIAKAFREQFPDDKFAKWLEGQWPEVGMPPDNVLGPRVTGGSVYKPVLPDIVQQARRAGKTQKMREAGADHVEVEYEVSTRKPTGFNIHLAREGKSIFMPIREAEPDISMIDLMLLKDDPEAFCKKYAKAMIESARQRLEEGTVGTPEELKGYRGESWMSPEQIAVLVDLRADCG